MKFLGEVRSNAWLMTFVFICSIFIFHSNVRAADATAEEIRQWVDLHNQFRAQHQVGPVRWSDTVAASAQAFADSCPTNHSSSGYGENLAWGYRSINSVVTGWYSEEELYDYSNPGFSYGTGHFTQVVWKGTTEIGCALKTGCPRWSTTWVCQYNPPGNINTARHFRENVFPKKERTTPSTPSGLRVE